MTKKQQINFIKRTKDKPSPSYTNYPTNAVIWLTFTVFMRRVIKQNICQINPALFPW